MTLTEEIIHAVREPRPFARRIMAWNPPMGLRWQALILFTVIASVITTIAFSVAPSIPEQPDAQGPFVATLLEFGLNVLTVVLVQGIGQLFGGKGRFADALLLIAALQGLLLPVQIVQCILLVTVPALFLPMVGVGIVLMFWLLTHFTTELHGFASPLRVLGSILGFMVLLALAISPFVAPFIMPGG
jgi:hypothetical protein